MQETSLLLYGTDGCHLCEAAAALLIQLGLTWHDVDVAQEDALLERYGSRIPVLRRADGRGELGWPFRAEDVLRLLDAIPE